MTPEAREQLLEAVLGRLRERPDGYTEHELLKSLRAGRCAGLPTGPLADPLVLFRSHWSLFHALYALRERLLARGEAWLRVDPLAIRLAPYAPGEAALTEHDPVREVYRDLGPLHTTSTMDVMALIGGFHARLRAARHYHRALADLELAPPADLATMRRQYRRLAMRYHPDRGGDPARFAVLQEARDILERYFEVRPGAAPAPDDC